MTPRTYKNWQDTCSKLSLAVSAVQLKQCEPVHLYSQVEMHLLMFEGLERLCAVVVEGTGCIVEWV